MATLNLLPKQNQNCLYITKIASLKQSRLTFFDVRKQQGRLGLYNKQCTLYKVSGIPIYVLVWIWKKGLHLAGVGKQANEVCIKWKLSLKTTQQQAIISMSPSQSKSLTVTGKTSGGIKGVQLSTKGAWSSNVRWGNTNGRESSQQ